MGAQRVGADDDISKGALIGGSRTKSKGLEGAGPEVFGLRAKTAAFFTPGKRGLG
jgi:hypothetical protein